MLGPSERSAHVLGEMPVFLDVLVSGSCQEDREGFGFEDWCCWGLHMETV